MKSKPINLILGAALFTIIGLAGGYLAALQKAGGSPHDEVEHEASKKDQANQNQEEEAPSISVQALKNLRVKIEEIEESNYSTYLEVTARVESTPKTVQPILAPIGGVIQKIHVEHGEMVKQGTVLMTLLRDAIPRAEIKLVSSLLVPEKRLKGLSSEEISKIENTPNREKQSYLWKHTLKRNGHWPDNADEILSTLPDRIRKLPFTIALIGELTANGYYDKEFISLILANIEAREKFFDVSSLILQGKGIPFIENLITLGALNSKISIKAPLLAEDFDVHEIKVKPGDRVMEGSVMGELHNMRDLHIESRARGSEISLLLNALENNISLSAVPLAKGSGIELHNLKIRNILDDKDNDGATAHLEIPNNPFFINKENSKSFRSWKIRAGTKYMIRVPQKHFKDVYVIPSRAVVEEGIEKVVFIQDGDIYKSTNVVVLYQNNEVAVLSKDSNIFPGDPIVVRGAFALGLALKEQAGGEADPHAGHSH